MRIGIEAQRIFRKHKHGMDFVALNYIKYLAQNPKMDAFYVFCKQGELKEDWQNHPKINWVFIPKVPYPIWEQILLPLYVRKYRLNFLHCTSNTAPLFGVKNLILTVHDIIYLDDGAMPGATLYQKLGKWYRKTVVPRVITKAAHIITVSKSEEKRIATKFPKCSDKLSVVYNAANEIFYRKHNPVQELKNIPDLPKNYILFLGNTDPKKNVLNLLRAYLLAHKKMPDLSPLFMPDFPKRKLNKFLHYLGADESVKAKIIAYDYVPNNALAAVISKAQCFVYPSLRESFGIPVLEAFLCRTLLLASNTGSIPEVSDGHALLFNPHKANEIADALLKAQEMPQDERDVITEKAYARAQFFSWEKSAEQLAKVYQTLM